tara:strand:+ start:1075 stop:1341 length:267 start_codon:yes stop_codon:yes gene_type:complete
MVINKGLKIMSELDNNDRIRLEQIMARRVQIKQNAFWVDRIRQFGYSRKSWIYLEGIILGFIITGLIRASLQGYIPTTATFNYIKSLF